MLAGQAARPVGGTRQGQAHAGPGHPEGVFGGVTHRVDVRVGGAHPVIRGDAAAGPDGQASVLCQADVGPHADTQQDEVGRQVRAIGETDASDRSIPLLDGRQAAAQLQAQAVILELAVQWLSHLGVQQRHDLRLHLDERHLEPAAVELLGGLQAHVAATHDDGASHAGHGRRDAVGIVQRAQREDAPRVNARDGRYERDWLRAPG